MKKPDDLASVQRLIGMVKYLSKFLVDLSQICEPTRHLTHKNVPWSWGNKQNDAFEKIKKAVTSAPVLKYFDTSKPTEGSGPHRKELDLCLPKKIIQSPMPAVL